MDSDLPGKYYPRPSETMLNDSGKEPLSEEGFRQVYQYEPKEEKKVAEILRKEVRCSKDTIPNRLPIVKWLPKYKVADLIPDFVSGLTVGVMHIPQGMAYAVLAGLPPVVGIYTAIFPIMVYILMGTSPHISMGTFAVLCMMVGKSVAENAHEGDHWLTGNTTVVTPVQVASVVCFSVGGWQVLLGVLRLGSLSVLLSKTLISGFTTGAAVHVFTSQVKSLLGLRINRYSGPLKIAYTYYEIFSKIREVNYVAVVLSLCILLPLGLYNEFVKPFLNRKFKRSVPVPVELMIIVIATLVSTRFDLHEEYGLKIIGEVPTGLPVPTPPAFYLLPDLIVDGLIDAIVAIAINLSMANMFATKHGYRVDATQEMLASGVGNIFGSFFLCLPYAASLSRSLIQESAGARTQIGNVVSCVVLILVLLFIAPFFEPLPYCVLASIIVIALKGMFLQFRELVQIMKLSKIDGFVWISTFLTVVILDIDYGLGVGIFASIATMVYRSQVPRISVLGRIPGTQMYKDRKRYKKAVPHDAILILQTIGGLHFANADDFRRRIFREILDYQTRSIFIVQDTGKPVRPLNLILDMSSVPYMDPAAVSTLSNIAADLEKVNSTCVLCDFVPSVYDDLQHCRFFEEFPVSNVFPCVSHAVEFLESQSTNKIIHSIA